MTSPWITLEEFMDYFRQHKPTARTHIMFLARSGKIPGARKVNGKWLFHREKMERWGEEKRAA